MNLVILCYVEQAMGFSQLFCILGWLAITIAKVCSSFLPLYSRILWFSVVISAYEKSHTENIDPLGGRASWLMALVSHCAFLFTKCWNYNFFFMLASYILNDMANASTQLIFIPSKGKDFYGKDVA